MKPGYKSIKALGSGNQGQVYLIRSDSLGKNLVWKRVNSSTGSFIKAKNECRVLEYIKPECKEDIVCLEECVESTLPSFGPGHGHDDKPTLDIYLEALDDDVDLFDYIDQYASYADFPVIYTIIRKAIDGLNHLHRMGVAHNDVKPENMMVNPITGNVKYIDFDFACIKDDPVCSSRPPGVATPYYSAPEVWQSNPQDSKTMQVVREFDPKATEEYKKQLWQRRVESDIWSLGASLFALLFNIHPVGTVFMRRFDPIGTFPRSHEIRNFWTESNYARLLETFPNGFPMDVSMSTRALRFQREYPNEYKLVTYVIQRMLQFDPKERMLLTLFPLAHHLSFPLPLPIAAASRTPAVSAAHIASLPSYKPSFVLTLPAHLTAGAAARTNP